MRRDQDMKRAARYRLGSRHSDIHLLELAMLSLFGSEYRNSARVNAMTSESRARCDLYGQ